MIVSRLIRWMGPAMLVAVALSVAWASAAPADGTIQFLDDQAVTILLSQPAAGGQVTIVNGSANQVQVTLTVVGPAAAFVSAPGALAATIDKGAQRTFALVIAPSATAATGKVLATTTDGMVARIGLALVGQRSPSIGPLKASDLRPGIVVGAADSLSLTATSYAPSLFRPGKDEAIWLAAIAIIAAGLSWAAWNGSRQVAPANPTGASALTLVSLVAAGAILLTATGAAVSWAAGAGRDEVPVPTIPVVPPPSSVTQGFFADQDGRPATLASGPQGLSIRDVDRAGAYKGKLDLRPDSDGGDLAVTLTVRDWYPYAAVPIALGVLIGYLINVYFSVRRKKALFEVALDDMWAQAGTVEAAWSVRTAGWPWMEKWLFLPTVEAAVVEARNRMQAGQLDQAEVVRKQLVTYLRPFDTLRWQIDDLGRSWKLLEAALGQALTEGDIERGLIVTDVVATVMTPLDIANEDLTAQKLLKERDDRRRTATANLANLQQAVSEVLVIRKGVGELAAGDDERTGKIVALKADLIQQLRDIVREPDVAGIASARATTATLRSRLDDLQVTELQVDEGLPLPNRQLSRLEGDRVIEERDLIQTARTGPGPILITSEAIPGAGDVGDADDLLLFSSEVAEAPDGPLTGPYHWWFGDGVVTEPEQGAVPGAPWTMRIRRMFPPNGGTVPVQVRDADDTAVQSSSVTQRGPGRMRRGLDKLRADDRAVSVVAGALAVGSGLVVLYFTNSSWGAPSDYFKALLWGSTTAEGAKAVAGIAARFASAAPAAP